MAQKKRSDMLSVTQKTPALYKIQFEKRRRLTFENDNFLLYQNRQKLPFFLQVILDFFLQEPYFVKRWGSFALRSVHQNASFTLSKTGFGQFFIFFIIRGDPYDLGGLHIYQQCLTRSKIENKNSFEFSRLSVTIICPVQQSITHVTQMRISLLHRVWQL